MSPFRDQRAAVTAMGASQRRVIRASSGTMCATSSGDSYAPQVADWMVRNEARPAFKKYWGG
jgi:hypothetical protein